MLGFFYEREVCNGVGNAWLIQTVRFILDVLLWGYERDKVLRRGFGLSENDLGEDLWYVFNTC